MRDNAIFLLRRGERTKKKKEKREKENNRQCDEIANRTSIIGEPLGALT